MEPQKTPTSQFNLDKGDTVESITSPDFSQILLQSNSNPNSIIPGTKTDT